MSDVIMLSSQPKKPFHHRNGSRELDVFEASGYFSGATQTHRNMCVESNNFTSNNTQKHCMRPIRRMSLDMPSDRGSSINPLQSMLVENPTVTMISKEKKFKQPSSPGGKLAHFLNSLFNQTSLKKSKSKKKSTKDEDESPGGWKRKRRSSISYFRSGNTSSTTASAITTAISMSDDKSSFSTSTSSGFRTPPPYHVANTPTKATSHKNPGSYSYLKPPPTQITKIPVFANLNKIENFDIKSDFPEKNISSQIGVVEKVKTSDKKQEEHHLHKFVSRGDIKEFKKFIYDDGADSDSSSDLFELTNCDFGYHTSGLPVYETTQMGSVKRCAPVSS